ncbi:MAG: hypothetical protein K9M75_08885 [Phycisphaerae bacterium]|nr:hypothetical protein [Phycisphaerae bacterium]
MAKKKKKTTSGLAFWAPKKKKTKTKAQVRAAKEATRTRVRVFSAIFGVVLAAAGVCVGFFYLEKYVKKISPVAFKTGQLEFPHDNVPDWFNEELAGLMRETAGGKIFELNENSAEAVGRKLSELEWFDDLKVQTTKDSLRVTAKYRTPVATIKIGSKKYCIAVKEETSGQKMSLVIMQHLNIAKLAIVEITGSTIRSTEDISVQEDVKAAVKLIGGLSAMDRKIKPAPPLLEEIARIDVSNFDGRQPGSKSKPHIIFYIKDGTPIYWGNAIGKTTGKIEAKDEDKLASLYHEYIKDGRNSLTGRNLSFIDLRNPR